MTEPIWLERLEAGRVYQWLRFQMNRGLVRFFSQQVLRGRSQLLVAELACGSGFGAHLLAQHPEVALSIAADLNSEDHHQAAIANFSASFVLMDIIKPAMHAGSMDFVWNSSSVEELPNPAEAVRSMAGLVKSGGRVFIGVPSRYGLAGLLLALGGARTRAWLGRVYRPSELENLLKAQGLQVEHKINYLFGIFVGMLAVKSRSE